jgi:RNA polymerase sigma-70 factor (ECF subfamily)
VPRQDREPREPPAAAPASSEDAVLVRQMRSGDTEAGSRFVRQQYPRIYRYLLYLTRRPDVAEDLTQETFLQAWRSLDTFDERASLRPWLHRIAHREFLQSLRRQRRQPAEWMTTALEEIAASPAPGAAWTDTIELHSLIGRLPVEEREAVILHYLEGYEYQEIARILGVPAGRVRHRLSEARCRLQRELGEGDLPYLNEPSVPMLQWAWLPLDQMHALATRLTWEGVGREVLGVGNSASDPNAQRHHSLRGCPPDARGEATKEESMERREFLRQAAVGAAGLMLTEPEKEIVDGRLTQRVTCAFKATALTDLCEKLKTDTGVHLTAGPSVADEKVTLFCEKLPLREVMRQLSRPFGYTWLRSGKVLGSPASRVPGTSVLGPTRTPNTQHLTPNTDYRYELVQDLRSQLLEEELRNRDRNEALLALDAEIERYRPYLSLSPDEVLARARVAPPAEKKVLESLGGGRPGPGLAWGVTQMYFRLTPPQLAALRAGEELRFSQHLASGDLRSWDQPLPPDVARGVLQSLRTLSVMKTQDGYAQADEDDPRGVPLTAVPEAGALVSLKLQQTELGQFGLDGTVGYSVPGNWHLKDRGPYAVGVSPKTLQLENAVLNAKLAQDPALQGQITVRPVASGQWPVTNPPSDRQLGTEHGSLSTGAKRVTSADVLEALHRATGMPIVADFYTRLYAPETVTVQNRPLFDALNQLGDTLRLRWNKETGDRDAGSWLQFRSMMYYHDRRKEVPNRLLTRWSTARRERGLLTLEELVEISQLPDAPLKGADMAEGARECWGLEEWDLARDGVVLANLRFLAQLAPAQRQAADSAHGLPFANLSLAQQQAFFSRRLTLQAEVHSLAELAGAVLRVDYTQPGWFEWAPPQNQTLRWAVRSTPGRDGRWQPVPPVRERTREAALQALRQIDPQIRAAVRATALADAGRAVVASLAALPSEGEQIVPTPLNLVTIYIPASAKDHLVYWAKDEQGYSELT